MKIHTRRHTPREAASVFLVRITVLYTDGGRGSKLALRFPELCGRKVKSALFRAGHVVGFSEISKKSARGMTTVTIAPWVTRDTIFLERVLTHVLVEAPNNAVVTSESKIGGAR